MTCPAGFFRALLPRGTVVYVETHINILGPLRVVDDEGASTPLGGLRSRQLLGILVLHRGEDLPVERIVDYLWGESAPSGAMITLRTYVGQVRNALARAGSRAEVLSRSGGYCLEVPADQLDFVQFERRAARGREAASLGRHHEAIGILREALSLWRGEVLSDLGAPEFAVPAAARLEELRLSCWELLLDSQLATGSHGEVIGRAQELVQQYPFRERFAGQLMLALYRSGRQADALRVAAELRDRLRDELGVDPSPDLRDLETAVLRQDARLDHIGIVAGLHRAAPSDALEVTPFVGRSDDRSAVAALLRESRVVTLTGFGGVGKTRLALQVAQDLRVATPDGVHFVALGNVGDPDGVAEAIAISLGLDGWSQQAASDSVIEYLRDRQAVLVIDNCEHLIDGAAKAADSIVRECPGIRILATSREPLHIAAEHVFVVPPLQLPVSGESLARVAMADAVQLFVSRAQSATADFQLVDDNYAAVGEICRQLEGIPLALELAAARLRALSPDEVAVQVAGQWSGLNRGLRTAPRRQSTMDECIEWSFSLCSPAEQSLWARASVFVDGFDLDDVSAVCCDPDLPQALELVSELVDKSILSLNRFGGVTRYRMLPPIRRRGMDELSLRGEAEFYRRRHRDHFFNLLEEFHSDRFGARQLDWIRRLHFAAGNIRAAVEFCIATPGEASAGLHAMGHYCELACIEGHFRQGRQWVDVLIQQDPSADAAPLALRSAAWWATWQGDLDAAQAHLRGARSMTLPRSGSWKDQVELTEALVYMFGGRVDVADQMFTDLVRSLRAAGGNEVLPQVLCAAGMNKVFLGDADAAIRLHQECLEFTEPVAELWIRGWSTWSAGLASLVRGDRDTAIALLRDSLRMRRLTSERLGVATCLETLACVLAESAPALAGVLLGAAQNEWEKIESTASALAGLGELSGKTRAHLRSVLGEARYERAHHHGRTLDSQAVFALAFGEAGLRAEWA